MYTHIHKHAHFLFKATSIHTDINMQAMARTPWLNLYLAHILFEGKCGVLMLMMINSKRDSCGVLWLFSQYSHSNYSIKSWHVSVTQRLTSLWIWSSNCESQHQFCWTMYKCRRRIMEPSEAWTKICNWIANGNKNCRGWIKPSTDSISAFGTKMFWMIEIFH